MPIYVFKCPSCFQARELILPLDSRYRPGCDSCQKTMEKQPTAGTPQFKGGGWAKDGYSKGRSE